MATTTDLISKINEKYGRMSKGQKLLANYIIDNYDKAVFLTAAKLGEIIGVSESTVVRFASFIGYKGYPEFQQALEGLVRNKLNTSDRIEITNGGIEQNGVLRTVLSSDALKIKNTMESIDEAAFDNAVETILNARRIYVVGIRTCAPLASFISFYLNMIFDNVVNLQTSSTSELFEQMIHITEEDCIIGISFPRYSMRTLKALEFANNRRANVITITDSIHSPMNLYSSCNLIAESDMHAAVDSLVAPLSVINALIVALCNKRQAQVAKNLEMIEEVWNDYQFYENDEIDLVDDSLKMYYPGEN
ncbi:MurR/RpiR family transcriptional regulator [Pseudobutyrivibrio sp.]